MMEGSAPKVHSHPSDMTSLNSRLQLALLNSKKSHNLIGKGFTLVELMIVIVIVAILSAVALPNFLKQTDKAKATEAKTSIAATIKQAQAGYIENGSDPKTAIADMTTEYGTAADGTQKFNYSATWADPLYTVQAVGNSNDPQIENKEMYGCVNMDTGFVEISQNLLDAGSGTNVDCDPSN